MKLTVPEPTYRVVSYIILLQSTIIVAGTIFVRAMLKANGYPDDSDSNVGFVQSAIFVRQYGFTLLLLPVIWAALTMLAARSRLNEWFGRGLVCLGIFAVPIGLFYYLGLGVNSRVNTGPLRVWGTLVHPGLSYVVGKL